MTKRHLVHLIDASPYVFRAFFALPTSMVDPAGNCVNAVHGFAGFLLKYGAEEAPTHVGVAFDQSLTTSFRNEIYPAYKAQRELPPPDLEAQLSACRAVAEALGFASYADERFEADDLIATLCAGLVRRGHEVVVVSPDKDLAQLVSDDVTLLDYAKGVRYGPAEVVAKFAVRPAQIPDYLGLAGDSVDNIPGVKGVGPKTAAALLAELEDLDGILGGLDRIAELPIRGARSLAQKLADERDTALLSRELATVSTAAPVRARLAELAWRGADESRVDPLFERLGFEGLRRRISRWDRRRS